MRQGKVIGERIPDAAGPNSSRVPVPFESSKDYETLDVKFQQKCRTERNSCGPRIPAKRIPTMAINSLGTTRFRFRIPNA